MRTRRGGYLGLAAGIAVAVAGCGSTSGKSTSTHGQRTSSGPKSPVTAATFQKCLIAHGHDVGTTPNTMGVAITGIKDVDTVIAMSGQRGALPGVVKAMLVDGITYTVVYDTVSHAQAAARKAHDALVIVSNNVVSRPFGQKTGPNIAVCAGG